MCSTRRRSDSSMYGCFSVSDNSLQSLPNLLLISALCMSGNSKVILRLSSWAHTINAFIGRLMCSFFERVSAAAAATSDSCNGEPVIESEREFSADGDALAPSSSEGSSTRALLGLGEVAGEEDAGEIGVAGDPTPLALEEQLGELLLLLPTLVDVPMLCTTIIINSKEARRVQKWRYKTRRYQAPCRK